MSSDLPKTGPWNNCSDIVACMLAMFMFSLILTLKEKTGEGLCKISRVISRCYVRWYRVVLVSGSTNSIDDGAHVMVRLNRWDDSAPITLSLMYQTGKWSQVLLWWGVEPGQGYPPPQSGPAQGCFHAGLACFY